VSLAYMNYDDDYETSMARSARIANPLPTMFSRQQVAMEINVVMTPAEAKAQTEQDSLLAVAGADQVRDPLPWAYLELDPADVINVEMNDGRSYNAASTSLRSAPTSRSAPRPMRRTPAPMTAGKRSSSPTAAGRA
jgi:hypothetical protein